MLYTVTTNTNIQTIKNEIAEKAKEMGFGILKEYPFKNILQDKGYPIERDITVYELCNPAAAQAVLSIYPEFSVYLPCRVSLYEENGKILLSTIEIDTMLNGFKVDDTTKEHMHTIFNQLKKILSSWE